MAEVGLLFQALQYRKEGRAEGQRTIVRNMLKRGMTDADIMAIAECNQEFIDKTAYK